MSFQLPEVITNTQGVTYGVVGLVAITVIAKLSVSQGPNLDAFPAVGSSTWLGSWWASFKYLMNAQNVIREGYEKASPPRSYKSAPFKIAEPHHWTVILSNREHIEELARASDKVLSSLEAINDQIQIEYTLGPEVHHNPYHVAVVRSHLTRNLEVLYPEIRDEIVTSFAEVLDLRGNEWKSVPALNAIEKVVCRTSNRVFVGLPLCRNPDWIDLNIKYGFQHVDRLAARFTNVPRGIARGMKLLGPIIEERQRYVNEYGTMWDDKPNDLLSWLMEEAKDPQLMPEHLTTRLLLVNFAAIHTSSNSFAQALFYLAGNPQYIQPLREEVEGIIEKDGWSKAVLSKMRKIDSFLKECQRVEGIGIMTLARKAVNDFTFSDGTFIPKGTSIAAPSRSVHYDGHFYKNPEVFEPFRFAHMGEESENGPKHQFASTTTEYLPFGHGRHACPGRFFAANELKSMLAHIVMTYDVKLEDNAPYPASLCVGSMIAANPHAKVLFRNRVD
ncbi:cytochrome P450 [Imleria badia]|nr:cytochrome P450 [Imleria badia]